MPEKREEALLRQQEVLARFGEFALRCDDLQTILDQACRLVGEALHTELSKVMELQNDGSTLLVRAGVGWKEGIVGHVSVKAEKGSSEGYAFACGQPVISVDIDAEDRFTYASFIVEAGVKALVNVIIIGAEGAPPYGLLQVDSRQPRSFTDADVDFLKTYANLLAAAVARLRTLDEVRSTASTLHANESRLRTLIDSMAQLVWGAGDLGSWDWVSPQWINYTGLSSEASEGMGWLQAVHPDDRAGALDAWRDANATGRFEHDHRIRNAASGAYKWFQCRGVRIGNDEQRVEWIGTSTDIDDQIRARELLTRSSVELEARVAERTAELQQALDSLHREVLEREEAQEQLRQGEKLKAIGQLTGGIAHDFNNMLQALTGGFAIMRLRVQQGRFAELPHYLDRADKAAGRAAALTQRLLAFARQQPLTPKPVDLDTIASGVEEIVRRAVDPSIQVELRLNNGKWLVTCDPNQMESALLNLCLNARDAMPEGGWLTIATEETMLSEQDIAGFADAKPGRYVSLSVTDTGIGMTPEVVDRAFEPFFTTKPLGAGTGLGLSQAYGFVQQSGGVIQIQTALGKGTTVRICLPAREQQGNGEAIEPPAGKTVLLVEDEQDVREVIYEQLRDLSYRVLEASDAATGLRIMEAGARIDLLITDVGLPGGMNGRQLAEAARQRRQDLPVLLITGYAAEGLTSGMEVLRKPFAFPDLVALVRSKLGSP